MAKQKFTTPEPVSPERLIAFREARGLTVKDLAIMTGVDRGTLTRYESGEKPAHPMLGLALGAIAYGLPPYQ